MLNMVLKEVSEVKWLVMYKCGAGAGDGSKHPPPLPPLTPTTPLHLAKVTYSRSRSPEQKLLKAGSLFSTESILAYDKMGSVASQTNELKITKSR